MQGSQYTFRLVQICTPEPCKIVLMTDKRKRRLLCMVQVYKSCVDGLCTYQAFYRICCKQAGNKFTMLSGLDKQLLVKLGGLDTSVPNVATISLAVCCKALKLARVPAAMLAAFEDIRSRPNSMTVLAFPDHVLAPYAQPSPNPVQLQMTTPFPVTLPTCQLPADYKQRHGLHAVNKHLAHRAPFSQQLAEYKAWCTNPIQLDRPGRKHSSSTWQNSEKHIFLYLGYSHHYHQVSVPTMQLFLSTPLICHYVSFHIAAEHSHLTIRNFLSCAKRVLRWWQTKPGGKHPSLVEGLQWLQTMNEQVLLLFCVSSFVVGLTTSCNHSHATYSISLSSYMRIEQVYLVKSCTAVHACCDTVSAYQSTQVTHMCHAAENSKLLKLSHCSQCCWYLCGCCRWQINFPGTARTLPVCLQLASGSLLQSWCTSLTQHGNMLSWTCSKKASPFRPADSCMMQPWPV